jgi:hypothetical protein
MSQDQVGRRDEAGEEHGGDDDHRSRFDQFLVFLEPGLVRVPGPAAFLELDLHFTDEGEDPQAIAEQQHHRDGGEYGYNVFPKSHVRAFVYY